MPSFEDPHKVGPGRKVVSISDADSGRRRYQDKLPADLQKAEQQSERAQAARAIASRAPARIVEPRCHVCQHPFRDWIEVMLVKGFSYKGLGERVSPPVNRNSLSNHFRNHMDLQDVAFRAMLEREAEMQGLDVQEGVESLITKRAALELALQKGFEDIQNGITTVEPRDLIQTVKLLAEMDSHQQQVGLDELRAQVQLFIQAIKDVCTPEIQNDIAQRVKQLRKRESIDSPVEDVMDPTPVLVEATVVDDDES